MDFKRNILIKMASVLMIVSLLLMNILFVSSYSRDYRYLADDGVALQATLVDVEPENIEADTRETVAEESVTEQTVINTKDDLSSQGMEDNISGQTAEGGTTGQNAEGDAAGQTAEGDTAGQTAEGDTAGQTAEGDTAGQNAEGDAIGQNAEGDTAGQNAEDNAAGQNAEGDAIGQNPEGDSAGQDAIDNAVEDGISGKETEEEMAGPENANGEPPRENGNEPETEAELLSRTRLEEFHEKWVKGNYSYISGKFEPYPSSRVSHKTYDAVEAGKTYCVTLSNADYRMLIRELSADYQFIRTSECENGAKVTLSDTTAYVGITLYPPRLKNVTYSTYEELFESGMVADFTLTDAAKENDNVEDSLGETQEESPKTATEIFRETWRTGSYSYVNGKYEPYPSTRISHMQYDAVEGGKTYQVSLSNSDFHMLIRELDADYTFIRSSECENGARVTLSETTAFVGITLYPPKLKGVSYSTYEELFVSGMVADFVLNEKEETIDGDVSFDGSAEDDQKTAIEVFHETWRTGNYSYVSGKYEPYPSSRISHKDYDEVEGGKKYLVTLTNSNFHMLIRELDQNHEFFKTTECENATEIILDEKTAYVGITLYPPKLKGVTYQTYEDLFNSGMIASFELVQEEQLSPEGSFEDVLKEMLDKGDGSSKDVLQYQVKDTEALAIFDGILKEEYYLLYKCEPQIALSVACDSNHIVKSASISNLSADTLAEYQKLNQSVQSGLSLLNENMNETEKALILHDYLLDTVSYLYDENNPGYQAYDALVDGKAICQGYADALCVLFHEAGLDAVLVDGNEEHHAWVMVCLDGYYYHIDPTWDDLQSNYRHFYFLRNDEQFSSPEKGDIHFAWTNEKNVVSTSDKYDNWFIHDIKGKVVYYDGFWYYADRNMLKRAKIDGSSMETVAVETEEISVTVSDLQGVSYETANQTKHFQ